MHVTPRSPLLAVALLLAAAPFAAAETPLTDPMPPAVMGRPLEQIRPARPVRQKPVAAKPARPAPAAAPRLVQGGPSGQRPGKQAVDDRADPRLRTDDVGKGTRYARKPLAAGVYIGTRHRAAVRKYYEAHPATVRPVGWRIGEAVPRGARLAAVPKAVLASLPERPPGHRYVQLGGEVVMIAEKSRMVVDGVSRAP